MNTTLFAEPTFRPVQPGNSIAPRNPLVSPSLRLCVNTANRSLLRWLRAAELAAWEEPGSSARRGFRHFSR